MKGPNLKILLIFSVISQNLVHCDYTRPAEISFYNFKSFASAYKNATHGRIASGVAALRGEVDEFCYLSINFANRQLTCGCFLFNDWYIVTAANCLVE